MSMDFLLGLFLDGTIELFLLHYGRVRLYLEGETASEQFIKGQSNVTAPWGFINTASKGGIFLLTDITLNIG
jgi:hypothetical protein